MKFNLTKVNRVIGHGLLGVFALAAIHQPAVAQDKPAAVVSPAKDFKDERALRVLKTMSDTLAAAKTLSFKIRGIVPTPSPTGQYVSLFASSRIVMQRPNKMYVAARGDLFPSDVYYNGKTVTLISEDKKFYTTREAAGGALEALMQNVNADTEATAPFLDILVPDSYAQLTKDYLSALWVGQSMVGGVVTDHLAFTADGLDWEIWTGAADKLPRLMVVSYRSGERQPTFTVEFSEWKLNAPTPVQTFTAPIPKGATKLEFKQLGQAK